MPAPTIRGTTLKANQPAGADLSITVPSAQSGDVMVLAVRTYQYSSDGHAPTAPTGFTQVGSNVNIAPTLIQVFIKSYASEVSITLPHGTTTSNDTFDCNLLTVTNSSASVDGTPNTGTVNGVSPLTISALTASGNNEALFYVFGLGSSGSAPTVPTGMADEGAAGLLRVGFLAVNSGSTGSKSGTWTGSSQVAGIMFLLNGLASDLSSWYFLEADHGRLPQDVYWLRRRYAAALAQHQVDGGPAFFTDDPNRTLPNYVPWPEPHYGRVAHERAWRQRTFFIPDAAPTYSDPTPQAILGIIPPPPADSWAQPPIPQRSPQPWDFRRIAGGTAESNLRPEFIDNPGIMAAINAVPHARYRPPWSAAALTEDGENQNLFFPSPVPVLSWFTPFQTPRWVPPREQFAQSLMWQWQTDVTIVPLEWFGQPGQPQRRPARGIAAPWADWAWQTDGAPASFAWLPPADQAAARQPSRRRLAASGELAYSDQYLPPFCWAAPIEQPRIIPGRRLALAPDLVRIIFDDGGRSAWLGQFVDVPRVPRRPAPQDLAAAFPVTGLLDPAGLGWLHRSPDAPPLRAAGRRREADSLSFPLSAWVDLGSLGWLYQQPDRPRILPGRALEMPLNVSWLSAIVGGVIVVPGPYSLAAGQIYVAGFANAQVKTA